LSAGTIDQKSFASTLRSIIVHPATAITALVWIAANLSLYGLTGGFLPFDMPTLQAMPGAQRMLLPTLGLLEVFLLMAVVWWLTRKRSIPDMASRAPERAVAAREAVALLGYAAAGQVGGWFLGPLLGYRPFGFHIAGTLVGCSVPPEAGEVFVWMSYNFIVFAVVPYLWFRRSYAAKDLNLTSTNRTNDLAVILAIGVIESLVELTNVSPAFLSLSPGQMLIGGGITFAIYFFGTVLPTMVLIYAILLPRYLKLTGSPVVTVILGGLTYAAMHLVEGWSMFGSWQLGTASVIMVFLQYFGPGMIKSVLTLRTGNAWVHAFGYHAVAPHLLIDTPLFVKVFAIR